VVPTGDFNGWATTQCYYARHASGLWRAEIEIPAPGIYRYTLVINQTQWLDDPSNGLKEPDEYGGFNSLLHVAQSHNDNRTARVSKRALTRGHLKQHKQPLAHARGTVAEEHNGVLQSVFC
jgi:hypothetical protein